MSRELLTRLSDYVAQRMGLCFPEERLKDLERGLLRASSEMGFDNPEAYAQQLMLSPVTKKQIEMLASCLTVGETYFFRDGKSFDFLEMNVLPELIQARRDSEKYLRIWSAGCATGEEAYSVAILLRRLIPDIADWNIRIIASDVNSRFLEKAGKGIYGEWSFRDTPSWLKKDFFTKSGKGRFELLPDVRKSVTFFYHNLAEDVYPSLANNTNAMDLILCRNVLMYFTAESQKKVVMNFYHCLVNGGWLTVSPAETSMIRSYPFIDRQLSGAASCQKDITGGAFEYCEYTVPTKMIRDTPASSCLPAGQDVIAPPVSNLYAGMGAAPAVEKVPDTYEEALRLFERGCYDNAKEKITALIASDNNNANALALLSRIHANQGRLTDALDYCEKAIAADKLNPAYQYLISAILLEMGREDDSKTFLNRALYLDQDFALAHFALGNLARRKGLKNESSRHFENALSILQKCRPDSVVPESEGITAERMIEIITTAISEEALI